MYNISAFLYDETAAYEQPVQACADFQAIFKHCGLQPPGLLGDLGSGTGVMSILMAQEGWQIYGIEISEAMIDMANEKTPQLPPEIQARLTWTQGDITKFTLPEGLLLDVALCLHNTINHLPEWEQVEGFMQSTFQALKPGGVLILDSDTFATFQGFFNHPPTVVWDDGVHQMTRACEFDEVTGRANHTATLAKYDANGVLQVVSEEPMSLQYHRETKLLQAFLDYGFKVESAIPYNSNPVLYGQDLELFTPKILWTVRKPEPAE